MAFTEIYVDPSLAADSGTGTVGDPFGDLEYAIEQTTFDTTNGTRVNIKAGTDEVLAASLDNALADTVTTAAWVPTESARLVFQGYTTTAGDGGIGGISGGGSVGVCLGGALDYVSFIDLHLHNTGGNRILSLDNNIEVINCELDNSTTFAFDGDNSITFLRSYIHNTDAVIISSGYVGYCVFENGTTTFAPALSLNLSAVTVERNLFILSGASDGVQTNEGCIINNNSFYSNAGTGSAIVGRANAVVTAVTNNLIEGFSGTGGYGIEFDGANMMLVYQGGNSVYNCETAFGAPSLYKIYDLGGDETLSASPFTSASTGDFSPVNTGLVKEGSVPSNWNN